MAWGQAGARPIDDLVRRIADNDANLTSLTILRQRRFCHDDVASLVGAMAANTNLTELYCSSHPVTPYTASLLAKMLAASPNLRSICVGDSSLGDDGVAALAIGVAASNLTRLDLSNKGIGQRGAEALAAALSAAASLEHLQLNSNPKLADTGVFALCGGVGSPTAAPWARLRVLELQNCGVTAAGVRALAESPNCGRLWVLRLDGNLLGAEGGAAICELLKAAQQLQELHLRQTNLGDRGGAALAAALLPGSRPGPSGDDGGTNTAAPGRIPLILDLAECGLGPSSLAALRDAFSAGARLESLCLAGNAEVSDADVAALGVALTAAVGEDGEGPSVAHLDVSGTLAGPEAVSALSLATGLRQLSMVGCPLGEAGAASLSSSLAVTRGGGVGGGDGGGDGGSGGSGKADGPAAGGPMALAADIHWAELRELCISGTGLSGADLKSVFGALAAGGAPHLQSLEVGANPGTQEPDSFQELLESLHEARPQVAVYWRAGDDPAPRVR